MSRRAQDDIFDENCLKDKEKSINLFAMRRRSKPYRSDKMQIKLHPYSRLRTEVVQALTSGKEQARRAVEAVRVETYSQVGWLIHDHLLGHKERADYGDKVVDRLSGDVGLSKRLLYEAIRLYRTFGIVNTYSQLGWSHYRVLLAVPSARERTFYRRQADKGSWSVRDLEDQIRAGAYSEKERGTKKAGQWSRGRSKPLPALRGMLYTYRVIDSPSGEGLRLDLGFNIHATWPISRFKMGELKSGEIVMSEWEEGDREFVFRTVEGRAAGLHCYIARVLKVVDGDTIWLDIDCGFGTWTRQKVRLRGIDTPEISTPGGRRALQWVADRLAGAGVVGVTTTKPDKYDRYLADVFYLEGTDEPEGVVREGRFLNGELLKKGLAKRL